MSADEFQDLELEGPGPPDTYLPTCPPGATYHMWRGLYDGETYYGCIPDPGNQHLPKFVYPSGLKWWVKGSEWLVNHADQINKYLAPKRYQDQRT